jgi:hypothetical protein
LPSGAGRVGCGHRTPPPSRGSTPRPDEEHPVGERRGDLALQLELSLSSGDSRLASSRHGRVRLPAAGERRRAAESQLRRRR